MPNDSPKDPSTAKSSTQSQLAPEIPVATSQPVQEASAFVAPPDRVELLARARTFLASPQVRPQDSDAKRAFLAEKGLDPNEVDQLLQELPPSVPPRTYPLPPPSNIPNLLIGVIRIFSWLTGTSAAALLLYYRYLLPRLTQSYQARLALQRHQSALIARLTESVSALRTTQAKSYEVLPRTVPVYEDSQYAQCHAIDDLLSRLGGSFIRPGAEVPDVTILRCALEELSRSKVDGVSTEDLFRYLESKLPWLGNEDGAARQGDLWVQLNDCPLFVSLTPKPGAHDSLPLDHPSRRLWKYVPAPFPPTPPLLASMANLRANLLHSQRATSTSSSPPPAPTVSARQRTLQVLSDFTGYITTQTYSFNHLSMLRGANGVTPSGKMPEDELRREIRALKGLVLNRRSFLPLGIGASGSTSDPSPSSG